MQGCNALRSAANNGLGSGVTAHPVYEMLKYIRYSSYTSGVQSIAPEAKQPASAQCILFTSSERICATLTYFLTFLQTPLTPNSEHSKAAHFAAATDQVRLSRFFMLQLPRALSHTTGICKLSKLPERTHCFSHCCCCTGL